MRTDDIKNRNSFEESNIRNSNAPHNAPDIGHDLPHGRRGERGQTELDSQGRVDQSTRLNHDEVVHEAEADHGDGAGQKEVLELAGSGQRGGRRRRDGSHRRGSE